MHGRHQHHQGMVHVVTAQPPRAYLYDFSIDDARLKPTHVQWLDTNVVAPIQANKGERWKVWLEGTTSRTGTEEHNMGLSQRRALAVADYLVPKLSGSNYGVTSTWVGELRAAQAGKKDNTEDASDRAVQIALDKAEKPVPLPIARPPMIGPAGPSLYKEYKARMTSAFGAAEVLAAENLYFDIVDLEEYQIAHYCYSGLGLGLGLPLKNPKLPFKLPKLPFKNPIKNVPGLSSSGPWNHFHCPRRDKMSANWFEGAARFFSTSLSLGTPVSYNTFCFGGFKNWRHFWVEIKEFHTGHSFGLPSVTETIGHMALKERAHDWDGK